MVVRRAARGQILPGGDTSQAVGRQNRVSLLVNAKNGEAPAEPHGLPPTRLGKRCQCDAGWAQGRGLGSQREAPART